MRTRTLAVAAALVAATLAAVARLSAPSADDRGPLDALAAAGPRPAARGADGERIDFRAPAAGLMALLFDDAPGSLDGLARLPAAFPETPLSLVAIRHAPAGTPRPDAPAPAGVHLVDDEGGRLAETFRVAGPPAVAVLDPEGRIRLRRPLPADAPWRAKALRDAIASAIRGDAGPSDWPIAAEANPAPDRVPTFHGEVGTILRRSCTPCHRAGGPGPFALESYRQAARRAGDLADVTASRQMPPWKPTPGYGPPLRHDRTLLGSEIAALRAWAGAGAPEGEPGPPLPATDRGDGWHLGEPDLVLEMDRPFEVPASGADVYRCFVLPSGLASGRFLSAIDVRPGNPRVVHHTFGYVDTRGLGRSRDASEDGPGYSCFSGFSGDRIFGLLGGWTPGNVAHPFADGVGLELPAKGDVVLQVHYHPSGKPEADRTRLGLYFAKTPVKRALEWVSACADPADFVLPAGDPDVKVVARLTVPFAVDLHAMTPHMHLLGRSLRATVRPPGGAPFPLIEIADWSFNTQETYYLREPLRLPAGAEITIEGRFDNSPSNPLNPASPPREIRWGEGTTDDMLILFLALTDADQDLTRPGAKNDFMERFFTIP